MPIGSSRVGLPRLSPGVLQVQAGAVGAVPGGRHRVHVPLAKEHVVDALKLDETSVLRLEEDVVAGLEAADVGAGGHHLGPGQAPTHLRRRGDDDAATAASLAAAVILTHENSIVQKLDRDGAVGTRSDVGHHAGGRHRVLLAAAEGDRQHPGDDDCCDRDPLGPDATELIGEDTEDSTTTSLDESRGRGLGSQLRQGCDELLARRDDLSLQVDEGRGARRCGWRDVAHETSAYATCPWHTRPMTLSVGDKAPAFTLLDDSGSSVSLSDFRGQTVILYAYPAAMTPGCTKQACDFRDNLSVLQRAGYAVLGISPDKPEKLAKFREHDGLTFPLLSDPDKAVLTKYGAFGEKKLYGKVVTGVIRSTFVISPTGVIEHVFSNVRATGHVAKLMRDLDISA